VTDQEKETGAEDAPEEETASAEDAPDKPETDETEEGAPEGAEGADGSMSPEEEIADLQDKLLRALADTENLRRRSQKDREDTLKYSSANFARDMLSVADNLRRAIESIPEGGDPDGQALVGFIEGISLTEKELLSTLERHGIQKVEPIGEKFDPQFHEAMFEVPTSDSAAGTVVQVVETGYVIHDRLLRPAKVGIAKAGDGPSGPADPGDKIETAA
jgi:molecular chaperone GrpE